MGGAKGKVMILFKTNPTKDYSKLKSVRNVYGGNKQTKKLKIHTQSQDKITKNIRKKKKIKQSKIE